MSTAVEFKIDENTFDSLRAGETRSLGYRKHYKTDPNSIEVRVRNVGDNWAHGYIVGFNRLSADVVSGAGFYNVGEDVVLVRESYVQPGHVSNITGELVTA